jgi:hypothetical protein
MAELDDDRIAALIIPLTRSRQNSFEPLIGRCVKLPSSGDLRSRVREKIALPKNKRRCFSSEFLHSLRVD